MNFMARRIRREWDDRKAAENLVKHRVSFEEAVGVFFDPYGHDRFDENHQCKKGQTEREKNVW